VSRGLSGAAGLALLATLLIGAGEDGDVRPARCQLSELTLAVGPMISPGTGQNPLTLRLTNEARKACTLAGYPSIVFADRRSDIPFAIRHRGDQMIAPRRPTRVLVQVGRSAFVVVNKYRCDLGAVRLARSLRLGLPGGASRLTIRIPRWYTFAYCRGGNTAVATSPFVPTVGAALWHWPASR
jgi:hypothetical protein